MTPRRPLLRSRLALHGYKLIKSVRTDAAGANPQYQLFNLKQDPNETSDLAQQYPGLVQFMDACLNSKTSASYGGTDAPGAPRSTPILALEES